MFRVLPWAPGTAVLNEVSAEGAQSRGCSGLGCLPRIPERHGKPPLAPVLPRACTQVRSLSRRRALLHCSVQPSPCCCSPPARSASEQLLAERDVLTSRQSPRCEPPDPAQTRRPRFSSCFDFFSVIPVPSLLPSPCGWAGAGPLGSLFLIILFL